MRPLLLLALLIAPVAAPAAELYGRVMQVDKQRLYLQRGDAVISLQLTPQTSVTGAAPLARGDDVRASFTPFGNLACRVEVLSGPPPAQGPLDLRTPALVPDEGETRGAGSPLP